MNAHSRARVRDLAIFLKGKKPSVVFDTPKDSVMPYVLIENFDGKYTSYTNDPGCVRCERSDTIVVADGANTGLTSTNHEGYIGSTLGALRPNRAKVDPRYLFFFVRSNFSTLNTRTRGAAVPHLEKDLLLDLELTLPPLPEQARIVRILDEVDALRRLRAQVDQRTTSLIPAVFHDLFSREGVGEASKLAKLESLVEDSEGAIRTGPFGSQLLHSEFTESGVPVLAIDNVVENEFRWTAPRCVPAEKFVKFRRFQVFPGDVIVTIMGTVGRCCVAPDDLPVCMSTKHLCVITPNRKRIHPRFLWASLLFDLQVRRQTSAAGGGAIMEGWNSTIIKQLEVRVPPMPLQTEFASRVAEIRELEAAQTAGRRRLDDLFQSLLHRAFQGEL